jgi:hypothetical protein
MKEMGLQWYLALFASEDVFAILQSCLFVTGININIRIRWFRSVFAQT